MQGPDDLVLDPHDPNFDLVALALSMGHVYVATYVDVDYADAVIAAVEKDGYEIDYERDREWGNLYRLTVQAPTNADA